MIDRILFQVSRRYWDCNPSHPIYNSIDIVYGILFSIVLLNTDLNTVNIGARTKQKMSQKVFIKNTMSFVFGMVEKANMDQHSVLTDQEWSRKWKKDLEEELRIIYNSVRDDPIIQNQSKPKELTQTLTRSNSSWSVTNSVLNNIMTKHKKNKSGDQLGTESIGSDTHSIRDSPVERSASFQILIEGVLIRKHMLESDGEKARNRRWVKYWCAVRLHKDNGVELVMNKLSHATAEYVEQETCTPLQFGDLKSYPTLSMTEKLNSLELSPVQHLSVGDRFNSLDVHDLKHPVLSSPSHDYKIVGNEPDVFSLIHSYAEVHYHSSVRSFCFALRLADHGLYLYEAPSESAQRSWVSTINYWAARKSREPMRGGMGNVEYGWNGVLAELKASKSSTSINPNERRSEERTGSIDKRKVKIARWMEVPLSTRLISSKEEVLQFHLGTATKRYA
jgi:hypothetical protein